MKSKTAAWVVLIIAAVLSVSVNAMAQTSLTTFSGEINGYSPQLTGSTSTTGPYEIRGPWSLTSRGNSKADFFTELNMEESDGWCITQNGSDFDPAARGAHTHHIRLVNTTVTQITGGFQISGSATIMSNGAIASISPSILTIAITGGADRKYSNVTLTFQAPASNHFGTQPIPGVVQSVTVPGATARK
jgi:hypothetical protein